MSLYYQGFYLPSILAKDREPQRELNDWTRKGPLPDLPGQRDGGMRRGMGDRAGSFRQGPPEGVDSKPRDFGNWERKGPLTPAEPRPQGERRASNFNREPREPSPSAVQATAEKIHRNLLLKGGSDDAD